MRKTLLALCAAIALLMCGCEKEEYHNFNPAPTPPEEPTIGIADYVGNYLMTREADFNIQVMDWFAFPLQRDLNVEVISIRTDPLTDNGVILSSTDGLYLHGTVDEKGLHLENDTVGFTIDTVLNILPLNTNLTISMTHPVIAPPKHGVMKWTSMASGTGMQPLPWLDPFTVSIVGVMRYRSVVRN